MSNNNNQDVKITRLTAEEEEAQLLIQERMGFLYFNRHGDPEWDCHNGFYSSDEYAKEDKDAIRSSGNL
jgi:hypothetical protein